MAFRNTLSSSTTAATLVFYASLAVAAREKIGK
jgi:hypothetical protein